MLEQKIKLADREDVSVFVKAAAKCDFDIDNFIWSYFDRRKVISRCVRTRVLQRTYGNLWRS